MIASRSASARAASRQLLAIAGDEEQAIIRSGPEEHDDDENACDIDHLERDSRDLGQQGNPFQRRNHRKRDRQQGDHGQQRRAIDDQQDDHDQSDGRLGGAVDALIRRGVHVVPDDGRSGDHPAQALRQRGTGLEVFQDVVDRNPRLFGQVGSAQRDDREYRLARSLGVLADQTWADNRGPVRVQFLDAQIRVCLAELVKLSGALLDQREIGRCERLAAALINDNNLRACGV